MPNSRLVVYLEFIYLVLMYNSVMNTTAIQILSGRWPDDTIPVSYSASKLFSTPRNRSIYEGTEQLNHTDSQAIKLFASENGFSYAPNVILDFGSTAPAWLGTTLNTTMPVFAHEISGQISGYPVTMLLAYKAANAQKKGSQTVHLVRKSIICVTLPKYFPQIVLESNKNDKTFVSSIETSFKTKQRLELEGNFSEYFDLYSPLGLQLDTLTLLAPNFMQQLIDSSAVFDVELIGNKLYLVTKDPIYAPAVMQQACEALQAQLGYFDRIINSWDYQPAQSPFDLLEKTYIQGQVVKIGPVRISPLALFALILLAIVLFAIAIQLIPD